MSIGSPPRLAKFLLKYLSGKENLAAFWGDVEEIFCDKAREKGVLFAKLWYWRQVVQAVPHFCRWYGNQFYSMSRNYIVMGFRTGWKSRGASLIALSGLVVGLSVFSLIWMWVSHEMSYDRFHENARHIYRVCERRNFENHTAVNYWTPGPLAAALTSDYPEIRLAVRTAWTGERVIHSGERRFYENRILCADGDFFKIFSFSFVQGDPDTVLDDPSGIVLTESMARKYFGDRNPMGKNLEMDNKHVFVVKGIIRDVPRNTHIKLDMLVPFDVAEKLGWAVKTWDFSMATTYLLLKPDTDIRLFSQKISDYSGRHQDHSDTELFLQSLMDIHLHSSGSGGSAVQFQYVMVIFVIGVMILSMACINYMNLATARSEMRSREIGIRKVVGAGRRNLVGQFLTEALLLTLFAFIMVPLVIRVVLPEFNRMTGIQFIFRDFIHWHFLGAMVLAALFTGLAAGIYPALVLSSFQPKQILAKTAKRGRKGSRIRLVLVTIQMVASLLLILTTHVMMRQITHLKHLDLGMNIKNVAVIPLGISNSNNQSIYNSLKNSMMSHKGIGIISSSFNHPLRFGSPPLAITYNGHRLDKGTTVNMTSIDYDLVDTLKINVIEGRKFSRQYGREWRNLVVNQAFARMLGPGSAVNKQIFLKDNLFTIVGVVADFHTSSVIDTAIRPLVLFFNGDSVNYILVRFNPNSLGDTLKDLETAWGQAAPNLPFQLQFLDAGFEDQFRDLDNLSRILRYFTVIGIFIACLGLFGLSSFYARRRRREISIRRILGSSTPRLVIFLSRDYIRLAAAAILISWPIGFVILGRWLQNYPNRISLPLSSFIFSGCLAVAITVATVIFQNIRAANSNPIDTIRTE